MSHFTKVDTKISNLVALKHALDDLNVKYVENEQGGRVQVRGWRGILEDADLCIKIEGSAYDIGLRKVGENYEMLADWNMLEEEERLVDQQGWRDRLMQRYSYHVVKDAAAEQGFTLEEEEVQEDKTIRLVVRKWS